MRRTSALLRAVAVSASLFSLPVVGVLSAQQAADIPAPTVRVTTRLVLVDVVVRDKQGNTVKGLKPDDFVLEENGKKQKIATLINPADDQSLATPNLAPGLYTNRPDFLSPGGPPTVIILDAANASFRDQAYARLQMLKYVSEQAKPGQRIAIFALTNTLNMIQDFTSDPQILQAALRSYSPQEPALGNAGPPAISAAAGTSAVGPASSAAITAATNEIRGFQSAQVGYVMEIRIRTTLEAMRALGRALGGIPGRKEVIWLTAAFPFDFLPQDRSVSEAEMAEVTQGIQQMGVGTRAAGSSAQHSRESYSKDIERAAAELSNAQVAIYPVDVRGLASGMEITADDSAARQADSISGRALARMSDITSSQETMKEIASQTGGKAYVNQNEIREGVAQALADTAAAYTIGYYPDNKKWDGKYRNIKVKLNRDGLQVLNRKGYFAVDPSQEKNRKSDQEVAETLRTDVPATLITFSARAKTSNQGKLGVDFLIDAHTLSSEDASGGGKKFNFTYYAAVFSPQGKILANQSMKVEQSFNADTYQQILQHGMMLHMDTDITPAPNEQLRLVVRDERTGYMGSTVGPLATQ